MDSSQNSENFKEPISKLLKFIYKIEKGEILPNYFYKVYITLRTKTEEKYKEENFKIICDEHRYKIVNKNLVNKIQDHIKSSFIMTNSVSLHRCRDGSTFANL